MAERTRAEELYDQHRDKVWEDIKSGTENFDKYMLTFSSGALGLSLAFVKDVVPLGKSVWVPWLISSWVVFVICILVTLLSFRISIRALEKTIPYLKEYYLESKADAFDKHLQSFWSKAVDWCTVLQITFFILGLIFTMMFVGANIREAKRVSEKEIPANSVRMAESGKSIDFGQKPVAMSPLVEGVKPIAMTPVANGREDRSIKPVPMTPVQPAKPAPAPPASSEKK